MFRSLGHERIERTGMNTDKHRSGVVLASHKWTASELPQFDPRHLENSEISAIFNRTHWPNVYMLHAVLFRISSGFVHVS